MCVHNTQVTPLHKDTYVTQIHWLPTAVAGARKQAGQSELFVLTCTDGKLRLHMHMYINWQLTPNLITHSLSQRSISASVEPGSCGKGRGSSQGSRSGSTLEPWWNCTHYKYVLPVNYEPSLSWWHCYKMHVLCFLALKIQHSRTPHWYVLLSQRLVLTRGIIYVGWWWKYLASNLCS